MSENIKIISRLDAIIVLLLSISQEKEVALKLSTLFNRLKMVGLTNEEIANIFIKTPSQVAKIAYESKRSTKK